MHSSCSLYAELDEFYLNRNTFHISLGPPSCTSRSKEAWKPGTLSSISGHVRKLNIEVNLVIDDWRSLTTKQHDVMQRGSNRQRMVESFIPFVLQTRESQEGNILELIALSFHSYSMFDNDENFQGAEWGLESKSP